MGLHLKATCALGMVKKKNLSHNEKWQSKAGVSNASTLPTLLPLGHMGPSKKGGQELS